MKRTITINLSGMAFIIDEDAYKLLETYFADIASRLVDEDERREVINDIEFRTSEIFRERGVDAIKVVDLTLVRYVISIIGNPRIFGSKQGTAQEAEEQGNEPYTPQPTNRKLRRDPYDKVIGGVCSGVAVFFNIDLVLVRVITFLLIFLGGVSLWVYIVLWIVIPKASTPQELALFNPKSKQ